MVSTNCNLCIGFSDMLCIQELSHLLFQLSTGLGQCRCLQYRQFKSGFHFQYAINLDADEHIFKFLLAKFGVSYARYVLFKSLEFQFCQLVGLFHSSFYTWFKTLQSVFKDVTLLFKCKDEGYQTSRIANTNRFLYLFHELSFLPVPL